MNDKGLNHIEKQIDEIEEWNKNVNNPGYYTTSSRMPLPLKRLSKFPLLILFIGLVVLIPSLYNTISNFHIFNVFENCIQIIVGGALVYGGVARLIRERNK